MELYCTLTIEAWLNKAEIWNFEMISLYFIEC